MLHIETIADLRAACDARVRRAGASGSCRRWATCTRATASLMRAARDACDFVVVTIFVNPLQFGAGEDLDRYPRDLSGDLAQCEAEGVDAVFAPTVAEMYPSGRRSRRCTSPGSPTDLCGAARPTHFDGVTTVVTKLFAIAGPCAAYFGRKDAQQLAVIARLVEDLDLPVDVVGCPIVREPDGLAPVEPQRVPLARARAAPRSCCRVRSKPRPARVVAGERDAAALVDLVRGLVATEPAVTLEYVEVANRAELTPIDVARRRRAARARGPGRRDPSHRQRRALGARRRGARGSRQPVATRSRARHRGAKEGIDEPHDDEVEGPPGDDHRRQPRVRRFDHARPRR